MTNPQVRVRRNERRAVNAARTFLEEHDLIYQEVDLRNDFAKDAILHLARSGADAANTVALQIKGGRKYKRKAGHAIPIDKRLRTIWLNSSVPSFVIVQDPDDGELYWGNLAKMASEAGRCASSVRLTPDARLTPNGLDSFRDEIRLECARRRTDPVLNLVSSDPTLTQAALFDCLVVGRHDSRYLKLVRHALPSLTDQRTFFIAVHVLSHATTHPDIFLRSDPVTGNIIDDAVKVDICNTFRWTPCEIAMLLARIPEEEVWGRGTIGQSLILILLADPFLEWALDRLLTEAMKADEVTWRICWARAAPIGPSWVHADRSAVLSTCLVIALFVADDPRRRLEEIVERLPGITNLELFPELYETISEFGAVDIS